MAFLNTRALLTSYIESLIKGKKLIGISENQVKLFVDYLIPKDASRISRVGPGRQDDRFFVHAASKATRGNRGNGNNNGKSVKREPYKRVGVPRIALDHFIRNECRRDAMSNEIPHIVRVPSTKACSKDNPKQVFNPVTNRCVTVMRHGMLTNDFKKYFLAYPSGNVPLNVQYPLQFTQDNWWTDDDLSKPAQIPAGRLAHLPLMLDTFNQVYTCEDLRNKFKDKENRPWQDLHSPEKLQAIFDAWASRNVSNSNHNSAWSRGHNIKRENGNNTKLNAVNAVHSQRQPKRSRSNTAGSNTSRQCPPGKVPSTASSQCIKCDGATAKKQGQSCSSNRRRGPNAVPSNSRNKSQNIPQKKPKLQFRLQVKPTVQTSSQNQVVLNPTTNRWVNADGAVARKNNLGIFATSGAGGSRNQNAPAQNQKRPLTGKQKLLKMAKQQKKRSRK